MTNKPLQYQTNGMVKIVDRGKTALISRPGSGKTLIALGALEMLGLHTGTIIVACTGPAVATWIKEIPKWLGEDINVTVVKGKPSVRREFWAEAAEGVRGFYICNYSIFRNDHESIYGIRSRKARHWDAAIADEYHKVMRNRKTKTFARFKSLIQFIPYSLPTTGTSMGRHPSTLWTLFHLCDRQKFSSYWRFVNTYCSTNEGKYGLEILGPKHSKLEELRGLIDEYIVYIPQEVVANALPKGRRMVLDVEMTKEQERLYNEMAEEMIVQMSDGIYLMSPSGMDLTIKLQQILCCPKMLNDELGMGAGYEAILDNLEIEPHAIIFVPYRDAVELVAEALEKEGYEHVYIMYGGIGPELQKERVDAFRANRGIIVGTIAYAESWDAETCDETYFLGYTKAVNQLEQAEGRTQRAISKHLFVKWRYIKYANTHDDDALMDISNTLHNIALVMARPEAYIKHLKGE